MPTGHPTEASAHVLTPLGFSIWEPVPRLRWSAVAREPAVVARLAVDEWYDKQLQSAPELDLMEAQDLFAEASDEFVELAAVQARGMRICPNVCSPVETDLWDLGRARLSVSEFLGRHGYRGPMEGEVSQQVWRENPVALIRLAAQSSKRPEAEEPRSIDHRRSCQCPAAHSALERALGRAAFLQALDVARVSAWRIGELLAQERVLAEAADVFLLTKTQLVRGQYAALGGAGRRIA